MKKTLLLLSLLVAGIMQAQIVNIPDANFKAYLLNTGVLDANEDGEIQVSEALNIEYLDIWEHPLSPISSLVGLEAFTNITTLDVNVSWTTLDLPTLPQLLNLVVSGNNLTEINLEGLSSLENLRFSFVSVTSLDVTGLPNLQNLDLSDVHSLNSVTIGNSATLRRVYVHSFSLNELDLSGCPNLENIVIHMFPTVGNAYINLKNGNPDYLNGSAQIANSSNNTIYYVCIDEGEYENLIFAGEGTVMVNSYCTFTPGGDYNVITGSLLFDNDGNCDTNGTVISNIKLNTNDGTESGSTISSNGLYNFFTQAGTYTVTPDLENDLFTITPPFAEINFTAVDSLVTTQNFCLTPNGNHPDLDIVIVPFGAQPGFDANYKIVYRNKGNQTLSGSVVFTYGEDVLDFVSANPSEDSSSPGTLTWNYTNLAPFQQREIFVTLNVNGPMETPPVNIDDQLGFTATVSPVAGDETPGDNVFELKQIVVGSFDPNDITCLEGNSVHPDKIGEYLNYNINFENTGTAPATFIVVKDVINTEQFDMATLQMINASHPVQATVTDNKVEFRFDDIDLGPQSKGNVVFKIKTLNTLQVNDDVTQQADIFFDYNWPIVTNEATTVFEVLSRGEFEKDTSVKVYPNPSNGLVSITAASVIRSVELYDMQGRLFQAGGNTSLDISGRAAGMYFVKVVTEAGIRVEKVIKK